jgi:transposase
MVRHLNAAVDEVRRITWRQLSGPDKSRFKRTRWLWLRDPANLEPKQKRQLSALCRRNAPIVCCANLPEEPQAAAND